MHLLQDKGRIARAIVEHGAGCPPVAESPPLDRHTDLQTSPSSAYSALLTSQSPLSLARTACGRAHIISSRIHSAKTGRESGERGRRQRQRGGRGLELLGPPRQARDGGRREGVTCTERAPNFFLIAGPGTQGDLQKHLIRFRSKILSFFVFALLASTFIH